MSQFLKDVLDGLGQPLKKLSSKYFYDEVGDGLFQQIMQLEEYYLPRCEREIIRTHTPALAALLRVPPGEGLDLVELGAGDGTKTVALIEGLVSAGLAPTYLPLDISPHILEANRALMAARLPGLEVAPVAGDYFETYPALASRPARKLVLFMGSNIGNFPGEAAQRFLRHLHRSLRPHDAMLVAFDLMKDPATILRAYNDSQGVTRRFNLNLLARINRELGADFDVEAFGHYPLYNPVSGTTYSYLISRKAQTVTFPDGHTFLFRPYEPIHTEVSQKYDLEGIASLAQGAGLEVVRHFMDGQGYYALSLMRPMGDSA